MADAPSPSPTRPESLIKWALLYLFIVLSFVIAAEVVTEGDSSPLITQILGVSAPIGAVLILAIKGGQVVQENLNQNTRIEEKTDVQTQKIEKIEHAVNGKLDARFAAVQSEVNAVKEDLADIRSMLERALME